jgi:hypothetical protein
MAKIQALTGRISWASIDNRFLQNLIAGMNR